MSYTSAKYAALLCLGCYAFIGFGARAVSTGVEDAYPFFSWSLFATVPERIQTGFRLTLTAIEGERVAPVVLSADRRDLFTDRFSQAQLNYIASEMGRAILEGDEEDVRRARSMLSAHLRQRISYTVERMRFNPIKRFRTGAVESVEDIGSFTEP